MLVSIFSWTFTDTKKSKVWYPVLILQWENPSRDTAAVSKKKKKSEAKTTNHDFG